LPNAGKDRKFPQNLGLISHLSTTDKLFAQLILIAIQKDTGKENLLNASQFDFRADHSTTLQCMGLADHVALNFNNNMSTADVFLDTEKAFETTWHYGLLYKLSELEFSTCLI
jgi:hypothetical protein